MASKRKVSQVYNNNAQGIRLRGRPINDVLTVYNQILINVQLKTGKRGQKTADWQKSIREAKICIGL
jgi:hypothetical protein